jgi:hypothetical protein
MEDEGFNDRDFGAHSRSFSTCSPTLRVSSRDSHARLTSGWLAGLYREGVEPSGSLRKVSDHMVIPLSCHPDATIVPPKMPDCGFSLGTAPKLAYQTGPSLIALRLSLLPASPSRDQVCLHPSCSPQQHDSPFSVGGHLLSGAPPCERPASLYSRGPRSGPGYVVLAHHHLIDPIRPSRRHTAISPHGGLYAVPSLCGSA